MSARCGLNWGAYGERGDKVKAREYWEEGLGLYKRIGMPHEVEKVEGFIAGLGSSRCGDPGPGGRGEKAPPAEDRG